MAEWVPPKIDYWDTPQPVGGEDYKRIEGNLQYLKDFSSPLPAIPGNDYVLSAPTARRVGSSYSPAGVVKEFLLPRWGEYLLSYRVVTSLQDPGDRANLTILIVYGSISKTVLSTGYGRVNETRTHHIFVPCAGCKLQIYLGMPTGQQTNTIEISNVKVSYSIASIVVVTEQVLMD